MTVDETNYSEDHLPEKIDSVMFQQKIEKLNQQRKQLNKQQQKQVKQLEEDALPRLQKYEEQLET